MFLLLIAFLLGAILGGLILGILGALHQVVADHILAEVGVIVAWIWAKFLAVIAVFKPAGTQGQR